MVNTSSGAMKLSFQYKLFISLVAFFSVLFIALGIYYYFDASRQLYQEMSARAKIQAEEIALMPNLRQQVSRHDPQAIQAFMQQIAAHSDASFIVIGDRQEFICFIPSIRSGLAPDGRWRQPGGTGREIHHHHSQRRPRVSPGSKTPIVDDAGRVIGIVSVGYPTSYLDSITLTKVINIFIAAVLLLIALFIFSWYFTRSIKKQIFSLEPREIGLLVRQQRR